MRRAEAIRRNLKREYSNKKDNPLYNDIDAFAAEMVVAKHIGRYLPLDLYRFEEPDIPPDIEVRHAVESYKKLVVRANDYEDRRFVLVTGTMPTFTIVGWMRGADAKRKEWLDDPRDEGKPCWLVPQTALRDIVELKFEIDDVPF